MYSLKRFLFQNVAVQFMIRNTKDCIKEAKVVYNIQMYMEVLCMAL